MINNYLIQQYQNKNGRPNIGRNPITVLHNCMKPAPKNLILKYYNSPGIIFSE